MPIFKNLKQVVEFVDPITKEPIQSDDKGYLLLLVEAGAGDFETGEFVAVRGRRIAFDYLANSLGNYDLIHSYVLSGKIPLGNEVSLYSFLRLCLEKHYTENEAGISLDDLAMYAQNENEASIDLDLLYVNELNKSV